MHYGYSVWGQGATRLPGVPSRILWCQDNLGSLKILVVPLGNPMQVKIPLWTWADPSGSINPWKTSAAILTFWARLLYSNSGKSCLGSHYKGQKRHFWQYWNVCTYQRIEHYSSIWNTTEQWIVSRTPEEVLLRFCVVLWLQIGIKRLSRSEQGKPLKNTVDLKEQGAEGLCLFVK